MIDTSKVYSSKNHGDFCILKYRNSKNVLIVFIKTKTEVTVRFDHAMNGLVKDPFLPKVYGVGYIGIGEYKSTTKGRQSKNYTAWSNMLERCYSHKFHIKNKSYYGCSVCPEWHNFQTFSEWYSKNHVKFCHIDKDKKQKGVNNKIYSPETCIFISPELNTTLANAKHYEFINPENECVTIYNMYDFCLKNSLSRFSMGKVHSGNQYKHKGWTKA